MTTTLSLNWKRLSSKLNQGSKVTKQPVKGKNGKTKIKKAELENTLNITPTLQKSTLSPIELALWTKENDINVSDIAVQTEKITLIPQGNDIREKKNQANI